ncbi:hypothetical protein D6C91_00812 [Aureobasidium pullulans]|uniref:JmjC domain-containing protein n=1 Tax=Aureobasidium pullulans TaxID=5580 RepID=A0A4S9U2X1_AURPU|nr:hypothetical protein D6C91_00812 [Aureobasidium pullulans]
MKRRKAMTKRNVIPAIKKKWKRKCQSWTFANRLVDRASRSGGRLELPRRRVRPVVSSRSFRCDKHSPKFRSLLDRAGNSSLLSTRLVLGRASRMSSLCVQHVKAKLRMPAQRPRAAFEPIAPDFDINGLIESTPNFSFVDRISVDQIDEQGVAAFEKLVLLHVIAGGKPLVVDGFENRLDPWTFSSKWLNDNVGSKIEQSKNLSTKESLPLTIGHYLRNMNKLSNQFFENARNYKDKSRQRIYLKDIDCPQVWHDKLQDHIPPFLFYLNESTGDIGGPGANPYTLGPGRRPARGIARAGDLMSSLPPEMRAENLMCYIGHEGDFILIPPLAPHQVWNRGTRTMKVAWNRTTIETLDMAIHEALPKAKIVCRDEQYKTKAIIYYTLMLYSNRLALARSQSDKLPADSARQLMGSPKIKHLVKDFRRLLGLFLDVLVSEMFNPDGPQEKCEFLPFDSNVTCAYCRCNIFNRFLTCSNCKDQLGHEEEEPYDVCMDCYAMGRSCGCISNLKWTEQFKWRELSGKYDSWRKQLIDLDGGNAAKVPTTLVEARRSLPHKTLAEVCREQLKRRPFTDIAKPKQEDEQSEEDIIVDDEGRVKKTVKKKPKAWYKTHSPCHVCCKRHPNWKSAKCTTCDKWWCYGSLFRGADLMPLTIMQDPNWSCPHCQEACFAGACRKDPKQHPYEPKGTLLGHDTKRVADARSVECLVDFSVSNLTWLRDDDEDVQESVRIRRAREEAKKAKEADPMDEDDEEEPDVDQSHVRFDYSPDDSMIDPQLMDNTTQNSRSKLKARASLLPPPEAMLKGARPSTSSHSQGNGLVSGDAPEGYAPAITSGFIAPQASMYPDIEEDSYAYPDPRGEEDEEEGYLPISSLLSGPTRRNKRIQEEYEDDDEINMEGSRTKRRRVSEDPTSTFNKPRNEATKQFEKEKERKALDEAKKAGRFIAAQAALRGKKRVVRLPISGPRLAQLLAQEAAKAFQPVSETPEVDQEVPPENVLVRSDIAPKEKAKKKAPLHPSKMKIRVERDEDFSMRSERTDRRKRTTNADYEEVDVESDFNSGESDDGGYRGRRQENGKRRISSYIQKKHIDDGDLPDELPENYKDSRSRMEGKMPVVRPRPGPVARARVVPPVPPKELPQLDGTAGYDDDDASDFDDEIPDEQPTFEEENRRAKLEALRMVEEESARAPPPPMHRSIFDKGNGKKIRIVSKSTGTSSPSLGKK